MNTLIMMEFTNYRSKSCEFPLRLFRLARSWRQNLQPKPNEFDALNGDKLPECAPKLTLFPKFAKDSDEPEGEIDIPTRSPRTRFEEDSSSSSSSSDSDWDDDDEQSANFAQTHESSTDLFV